MLSRCQHEIHTESLKNKTSLDLGGHAIDLRWLARYDKRNARPKQRGIGRWYVLILKTGLCRSCRFATLIRPLLIRSARTEALGRTEVSRVAFLPLSRSVFVRSSSSSSFASTRNEGSDDDAAGAERRAKRERSCDVEIVDFTLCRSCDKCDDIYRIGRWFYSP